MANGEPGNTELVQTRIRPDIKSELDRLARLKGLSVFGLVRMAIHEFVQRNA